MFTGLFSLQLKLAKLQNLANQKFDYLYEKHLHFAVQMLTAGDGADSQNYRHEAYLQGGMERDNLRYDSAAIKHLLNEEQYQRVYNF